MLIALAAFFIGLFVREYFPSYLKKKAENLATKEDLEALTRIAKAIETEYQKQIAEYSNIIRINTDHLYKQLDLIYASAYAAACQSAEYKYFVHMYKNYFPDSELILNKHFINFEIVDNSKYIESELLKYSDANAVVKVKEQIVNVSFDAICDAVIKNPKYATSKILKAVIKYKLHSLYGEILNKTQSIEDDKDTYIEEIVQAIVKDYNQIHKSLGLEYCDSELSNGKIESSNLKDN